MARRTRLAPASAAADCRYAAGMTIPDERFRQTLAIHEGAHCAARIALRMPFVFVDAAHSTTI